MISKIIATVLATLSGGMFTQALIFSALDKNLDAVGGFILSSFCMIASIFLTFSQQRK